MVLLEVEERDASRRPKHLRKEGFVPMALVEPGTGTRLVQASESDIRRVISHSSGVGMFELQVKGEKEKRTVIVKQLDQDVLHRELLNVTVMQITREQVLTSDIPVHAVGTPEPIKENQGVLISPTSHIKVKGRAMDLPSHVDIDGSGMKIGDSINVEAVVLPEGVELASSHDAVLFSLQPLRQEIEETPAVAEGEEGATEPERVGEEKEDSKDGD
jgi:large subunit ribosomal protein L25